MILTEKTSSIQMSISVLVPKKGLNEKRVLLRKQAYKTETRIHKLKTFCLKLNAFGLLIIISFRALHVMLMMGELERLTPAPRTTLRATPQTILWTTPHRLP